MRFGYLEPFPQNPFAPKRILIGTILAGIAGGGFAFAMDPRHGFHWVMGPQRRLVWILICAGITGAIYAMGAVWMRRRLAWMESLGEAGLKQNLEQRRTQWLWISAAISVVAGAAVFLGMGRHVMTLIFCFIFPCLSLFQEGSTELERLLTRQRDLVFQARLAPHFLHGALSTLKAAIHQDPLEAQALVDQLARLSREAVAITSEREISLTRELAFVEAYLGVERARRGDALHAVIEISEALESESVPPMSLQLLVENALRHGLPAGGGEICIQAARLSEGLQLCVEDPGQGDEFPSGLGQSLGILRRRLERESDLILARTPEGRHRATLLLRRP